MTDVLPIIDVQRALLAELAPERQTELSGTLGPLLARARSLGTPVVYVRHDGSPAELIPGTPEWEIASDIAPRAGEPIVEKRFSNAFEQTTLTSVLTTIGADHLIVAGMQTDVCVSATIGGAAANGYRVTLVADGHATSASNGNSEQQIREAMHADMRARGVRIVPAVDALG